MECPVCKLTNPDSAQRCDCGHNFVSNWLDKPSLPPKPKYSVEKGLTIFSCLAAVIWLISLWFGGPLGLFFMLVRAITGRDVL